jgi:hypothetical protein
VKLEDAVVRAIHDKSAAVTPPDVELEAIRRRARPRLYARNAGIGLAAGTLVAGGIVVTAALSGEPEATQPASVGQLDFAGGLRAFVDFDKQQIHLGGGVFPIDEAEGLDTSGAATPWGAVYFTGRQEVRLLTEQGEQTVLAPEAGSPPDGFHPSSAFDAGLPLVAWATGTDDAATVRLYDLASQRVAETAELPCDGGPIDSCDVTVVAVDQGLVFVRASTGSFVWEPGADDPARAWTQLTGPDLGIVDVRNKTIMIEQAPGRLTPGGPVDAGWGIVRAPIDAQLSYDGRHILYWSTTLEPVDAGDDPIRLDVPRDPSLVFVTFDSDGSVLVATPTKPWPDSVYFDCELATGQCEEIGRIQTISGDPMFLGNDM